MMLCSKLKTTGGPGSAGCSGFSAAARQARVSIVCSTTNIRLSVACVTTLSRLDFVLSTEYFISRLSRDVLLNRSNVCPYICLCSVNFFNLTLGLCWANIGKTWHMYSVGRGTILLASGILNSSPLMHHAGEMTTESGVIICLHFSSEALDISS